VSAFAPFFERPLAVVIERGKAKYERLAECMLQGWGGDPAGVILREPAGLPARAYALAFVGLRPPAAELLREASFSSRNFLTVDNGYFHAYKDGDFFRVTVNAMQHTGLMSDHEIGAEECRRWLDHEIEIKPWRGWIGEHNLLVLQSEAWYEMMGLGPRSDWVEDACAHIQTVTPGPIRIRDKPLKGKVGPVTTFEEDLAGARCVYALSSACLIQAVVAGVPACPLGEHPTDIGLPMPTDAARERMCIALANNQWTSTEMAEGRTWRDLSARPLPRHRPLA
jgi:hypothetical protein